MFLTRLQATSIVVVVTLVFGIVLGGKKCSLDQYLNKNGKCRYCKYCPPGEGMNFTAQVPIDEAGHPLRCYPCIPCPSGTYNDPEAGQYACSPCRLNCLIMSRKEYEPCGGTKSGKCGACLNSSYEDRDNNMDSPCYKRDGVEIKGIKLFETNDKVMNNEDKIIDYDKTPAQENASAWWIYVIICGSGFVVVACSLALYGWAVLRKYKFPRKCADLIPSLSGASLMESSVSVGLDNNGVGHKYEQVSLDDLDLETDCITDGHMPHGEIENLQSTSPAALHITKKKQTHYPNIIVEIGNAYFNHLSNHLYGHQVPEIFRRLDLRDQTIFAELELYKLDRIKYKDAIYRLLLAWVRLKTKSATLASLCPILDETGLKSLSEQLLDLTENKPRNTEEQADRETTRNTYENSEIPDSCHICLVEDKDLVKNGEQTDNSKVSEINNCTKEDKTSLVSWVHLSMTSFDTDCVVVERETSL